MFTVTDADGNVLFGRDGRPLSFTGANAFRLATTAAYRTAKTSDGQTPYNGLTFVETANALPNGEMRWFVDRDGTIIPD